MFTPAGLIPPLVLLFLALIRAAPNNTVPEWFRSERSRLA